MKTSGEAATSRLVVVLAVRLFWTLSTMKARAVPIYTSSVSFDIFLVV